LCKKKKKEQDNMLTAKKISSKYSAVKQSLGGGDDDDDEYDVASGLAEYRYVTKQLKIEHHKSKKPPITQEELLLVIAILMARSNHTSDTKGSTILYAITKVIGDTLKFALALAIQSHINIAIDRISTSSSKISAEAVQGIATGSFAFALLLLVVFLSISKDKGWVYSF